MKFGSSFGIEFPPLEKQINAWLDEKGIFMTCPTEKMYKYQTKKLNNKLPISKLVLNKTLLPLKFSPIFPLPKEQQILVAQISNGSWQDNELTARILRKDLSQILGFLTENNAIPFDVWMTVLMLYFLEVLLREKTTDGWKEGMQRGEIWLQSQGFDYGQMKNLAKSFFFGVMEKSGAQVAKNCNCGKPLKYVKEIEEYKGDSFVCDSCGASNLMMGGVFHCKECQFDLCEECNNDEKINCNDCQVGELKWTKEILNPEYDAFYWCDVCAQQRKIIQGVYHCQACQKFDLCRDCKAQR